MVDIGPVYKWMHSGSRPSSAQVEMESPATRHYWNLWDSLVMEDGCLYRKFYKDGGNEYLQLLVPKQIRTDIINHMHGSRPSRHLGYRKTLNRTTQEYYWFEMKRDIQIYVQRNVLSKDIDRFTQK